MEERNIFELAAGRFRSVKRAIKRGLVSPYGVIYPKRPFNNRKSTLGRSENELKKKLYVRIHDRTKSL